MTQSIEEILEKLIEQVQQIAFDIPAPNDHTPVFVALATNARCDLNKFRAMHEARPVSTDGLVALAIRGALGLKGQQITDLQLDGGIERAAQAALAVIQPTLEALQRSNAEKDEALRDALELLNADIITPAAMNAVGQKIVKALSHSSETSK
jgi:hypothetical protein